MSKRFANGLVSFYFAGWLVFFTYFWAHALTIDAAGNIVAGEVNIWGDWAAHLTMTTALASRGFFLTTSPFVIGQAFSYPYLINTFSAVLAQFLPLITAMLIPSFIFSIMFVAAVYYFYKMVFRNQVLAIIASMLFIFNGGIGTVFFVQDVMSSPTPLQTIINPPREYTDMEPEYIRWVTITNSMIIPQRSFTLGFPLGLLILTWFLQQNATVRASKKNMWQTILVGALLGLMPIIHSHTFLNLFLILACWSIFQVVTLAKQRWLTQPLSIEQIKVWKKQASGYLIQIGLLAGLASIISVPILKTLYAHNVAQKFVSWYPGWYLTFAQQHGQTLNWFYFWFSNWGVVPLLAVLGFILLIKNRQNTWAVLSTPFLALFVLANLFLFQPWVWDNTKIIVWSSVGLSGLASYYLAITWQSKKNMVVRACIALIFLLSISAGFIDTYRLIRFPIHSYVMYTAEENQLAEWVRDNTDPNSIWLTGDQHNHWLFGLTGRQALMGYRGWLWTHGYKYQSLEREISLMFLEPAQNLALFKKHGVNFIVIGPGELATWKASKQQFDQLFKVAHRSPRYTIYQTAN